MIYQQVKTLWILNIHKYTGIGSFEPLYKVLFEFEDRDKAFFYIEAIRSEMGWMGHLIGSCSDGIDNDGEIDECSHKCNYLVKYWRHRE